MSTTNTTKRPKITVKRVNVPALIGHKQACEILQVSSGNLRKVVDLPPDLASRGIPGFDVSSTQLWPRAEIEELASKRPIPRNASAARKAAAATTTQED